MRQFCVRVIEQKGEMSLDAITSLVRSKFTSEQNLSSGHMRQILQTLMYDGLVLPTSAQIVTHVLIDERAFCCIFPTHVGALIYSICFDRSHECWRAFSFSPRCCCCLSVASSCYLGDRASHVSFKVYQGVLWRRLMSTLARMMSQSM
jgi:hypothetical protein